MSFFTSRNKALYTASAAMSLSVIPGVNLLIALGAASLNFSSEIDPFEAGLQAFVVLCAITYVPAVYFFSLSLTVFALTSFVSWFEKNSESNCSPLNLAA